MPFDVEAARKSGYSDAEIASFLSKEASLDLPAAKKHYSDSEIIAQLSSGSVAQASKIPGQAPGVKAPPATAPIPTGSEPGLVDTAIGTGEAVLSTATGATGGALGMLGGTLKGLAEQILSGKFGTADAANLVEQSAMKGAQALTYAPRTQSGQEQAAAVGGAMQQLLPVAAVAPSLAAPGARPPAPLGVTARAAAEGTARDFAGAVAGSAAGEAAAGAVSSGINAAGRVADLVGKGATTLPRRALEALRRDPEASTATPGTLGSAGAAGTDMAAQRLATAETLGFTGDRALTRGQATRDPAQLKFEVEQAKDIDTGGPLRQRQVAQNDQFLRTFDDAVDQTGAQAPNLRAVGQSVDAPLVRQYRADKAKVRAMYKTAEEAGELEAPVALDSVVSHLNESAPDAATAPILDVARRRAVQLGLAIDEGGDLVAQPVTLKAAEKFRQAVSRATDYEATNVRQATIIKGLVDEATSGAGGTLYRQARAERARLSQNYENRATIAKLLNTKRGTSDRQVAFEDVFDHTVLRGSLDDVRNVRRVLQRAGEDGSQAWRELQGQTVRWLRDEATKNVQTDGVGNRVISPASLDKAVRSLEHDGKLDFVFGKQGAQTLRDINDLAKYSRTVPPEAAINTSNTAATLLAAFADAGVVGSTGLPIPVVTGLRLGAKQIKDMKLRRRINEALNYAQTRNNKTRGSNVRN